MGRKVRVVQERNGKKISFMTSDKGKPGKTPEEDRWYEPGVHTGWKKDMPQGERRNLMLNAHKGDELAAARAMQSLANVTTDREMAKAARADAMYFYAEHSKNKPYTRRRQVRISPRMPRLRR